MKSYLHLAGAVLCEVFGTTMLNISEGFSYLLPTLGVAVGFGFSFFFLGLALKTIPLSIAYCIWAGLGTIGAGLIGIFIFNEGLSGLNIVGLLIIITGVFLINLSRRNKKSDTAKV